MICEFALGNVFVTILPFHTEGQRTFISRQIHKYGHLMPAWLLRLKVQYIADMDGSKPACVNISWEYRQACITIGPAFFDAGESDEQREGYIAHELSHIVLDPLADFARSVIERLCDEAPKFRGELLEQLRLRVEGATCDLTHSFMRAPHGNPASRKPRR